MKILFILILIIFSLRVSGQTVYSFYNNFENQSFVPIVGKNYALDTARGGKLTIVPNPLKATPNNSNYVVKAETFKSISGDHCRAEYRTDWKGLPTSEKKHIYQWLVYFPNDYMMDVTTFNQGGNWNIISQFTTHPCANSNPAFADSICGGGGIFNEIRINKYNYNSFDFKFRAYPDCSDVNWIFPKGKWIKITYEIFYTTSKMGYYRIWIDEKLTGSKYNIRTLPGGFIESECGICWKVGIYASWQSTANSMYYYFDNMKLYINKRIQDVCVNCKY